MSANRRTARRRTPTFLAALLAVLALSALGAGAAQAAVTWSVNGTSFTGEEAINWNGKGLEFQQAGGETMTCGYVRGPEATISGGDTAEFPAAIFSGCKLQKAGCTAAAFYPAEMHTELIRVKGTFYEKYTIGEEWNTWTGNECFAGGEVTGSFAAAIGPDAVESTRTFTAAAEAATGATGLTIGKTGEWAVRKQAKVTLAGANKGSELGAMSVVGKLSSEPVWHVEGETFEEAGISEKEFTLGGDQGVSFNIRTEAGVEISCTDVTATGVLTQEGAGYGSLLAEGCTLVGAEQQCEVHPIETDVEIGLSEGASEEAIESFAPDNVFLLVTGKFCPWFEETEILTSGEAFGVSLVSAGSEALELHLDGSEDLKLVGSFASEPASVWVDGPFTQQLYSGELFGAW